VAYITRDQLWAKPKPTFEPGGGVPSGLLDVCSMSARSCKPGISRQFFYLILCQSTWCALRVSVQ